MDDINDMDQHSDDINDTDQHSDDINDVDKYSDHSRDDYIKSVEEMKSIKGVLAYYWSILKVVLTILGYLFDVGSDIALAVMFYLNGKMVEFYWTLAFILIPSLANTTFSVIMYSSNKTKLTKFAIVMMVLQLAPVLRYIKLIRALRQLREMNLTDELSLTREGRNSVFLFEMDMHSDNYYIALHRILECYLETVPQQVLQILFLLGQFDETAGITPSQWLAIGSLAFGVLLVGAAFWSSLMERLGFSANSLFCLWQTLWHWLVTLSRVFALATLAYIFPKWMILACLIHIAVMIPLLNKYQRWGFDGMREMFFSVIFSIVYLFTFFLPNAEKLKYYVMYSVICLAQNVVCAVLWYHYVDDAMRRSVFFWPLLILSVVPYFIGAFMGIIISYISDFVHFFLRKYIRKAHEDGDVISTSPIRDILMEIFSDCAYECRGLFHIRRGPGRSANATSDLVTCAVVYTAPPAGQEAAAVLLAPPVPATPVPQVD